MNDGIPRATLGSNKYEINVTKIKVELDLQKKKTTTKISNDFI